MSDNGSLCASRRKGGPKSLRDTCWACGKPITPDPAPRALCGNCACGGYLGGS